MTGIINVTGYRGEDLRNVISSTFHMLRDNKCLMKKIVVKKFSLGNDLVSAVLFKEAFYIYEKTHKPKVGKYSYFVSSSEEFIIFHLYIYDFVPYLVISHDELQDDITKKTMLEGLLIGKSYEELQKEFKKLIKEEIIKDE